MVFCLLFLFVCLFCVQSTMPQFSKNPECRLPECRLPRGLTLPCEKCGICALLLRSRSLFVLGSLALLVSTSITARPQDEGDVLRTLSGYPVESLIRVPVSHLDGSNNAITACLDLLDPSKSVPLGHQGL